MAPDCGRPVWHNRAVTTRRVAWTRDDEVQAAELCTLAVRATGLSLVGTVIGAEESAPIRVEYRVLTDGSGNTTAVHVRDLRGFTQRTLSLERSSKGAWTVDGSAARKLKGCADVDLGISPSTNTLPIRRLRLGIGGSATIKVALVTFPELTVATVTQTYARLDEDTYRFASGTFEAQLTADEDGLVIDYSAWHRTGFAFGAEDTEPLDAR